jgi:hypothetical protein
MSDQTPEQRCEWLDDLHTAAANTRDIAERLALIASSFFVTGNEVLGEKLEYMANVLDKEGDKVHRAAGMAIHEVAEQSTLASRQMLAMALGGILVSPDAPAVGEGDADHA